MCLKIFSLSNLLEILLIELQGIYFNRSDIRLTSICLHRASCGLWIVILITSISKQVITSCNVWNLSSASLNIRPQTEPYFHHIEVHQSNIYVSSFQVNFSNFISNSVKRVEFIGQQQKPHQQHCVGWLKKRMHHQIFGKWNLNSRQQSYWSVGILSFASDGICSCESPRYFTHSC